MCDEELAAAGVRPIERHTDRASHVGPLIQFVTNRKAWSSLAVATRIASLNDEVRHHAVERQAVEELLACERDEVVHRERSVENSELELDVPAIGLDEDMG